MRGSAASGFGVLAIGLLLPLAACSDAKVAEAEPDDAVEATASELADLEEAIADTAVADVVPDDPGGRLAADGPVAVDPLASAYPEGVPPAGAGPEDPALNSEQQ